VGPRIGVDDVEGTKFLTLPGLELRTLVRPARSQSLYRLSYPGFLYRNETENIFKDIMIVFRENYSEDTNSYTVRA
jgi:hypothetical protein